MITVRILSYFAKVKKALTRSIPVLRLKSQSSYIVSKVPPFCFHDYCFETGYLRRYGQNTFEPRFRAGRILEHPGAFFLSQIKTWPLKIFTVDLSRLIVL